MSDISAKTSIRMRSYLVRIVRFSILGASSVFMLFVLACSDDDSGKPAATNTAAAAAVPTDVQAVIAAIQSGDAPAIRKLLAFQDFKCTKELGAGGPPKCAAGESDGTVVRVFQFIGCEPDWRREATVDAAVADIVAIKQLVRYAVFVPPASGYLLSGHQYVALLDGKDTRVPPVPHGVAVAVDIGRISAVALTCGAGDGAKTQLPQGQTSFLVAPP